MSRLGAILALPPLVILVLFNWNQAFSGSEGWENFR